MLLPGLALVPGAAITIRVVPRIDRKGTMLRPRRLPAPESDWNTPLQNRQYCP
jgi:hypothetical protein